MHLYYYRRPDRQPNFGDDLNTWLWPQLLPGLFDDDPHTYFVGTGTLLNQRLIPRTATAKRVIVFSSGAGYEAPLQAIPDGWKIICVRGPRSAQRLGLPPETAITDGGVLVSQCFQPAKDLPRTQAGFMPHVHHASFAQPAWESLCQQANLRYIDPRWPVEKILSEISSVRVLYAEAMHGAITADALRVPWVPVITSPRILRFKWLDWCASVNVPYTPRVLPPLPDYPRYGRGVRSGLQASYHWLQTGRSPLSHRVKTTLDKLIGLAQADPTLSPADVLDQRTAALLQALERVKQLA